MIGMIGPQGDENDADEERDLKRVFEVRDEDGLHEHSEPVTAARRPVSSL